MGRHRKTKVEKAPIKLRRKRLADGRESLFLDTFVEGRHSYEFLQLYLSPETSTKTVRENARTLRKAEDILAQRVESLYSNKVNFPQDGYSDAMLLSDWMEICYQRRIREGKTGVNVSNARINLLAFRPDVTIAEIDRQFCLDYMDWLRNEYVSPYGKKLSQKTAYNYAAALRTVLNDAVNAKLIASNPWNRLDGSEKIKEPSSKREFLTIDEVKSLVETTLTNDTVKRAFLFSCFSGLRFGDISQLTWGDINTSGEEWNVSLRMEKTSDPIWIPLSRQARKWLPSKGDSESLVFPELPDNDATNRHIRSWTKAAGIPKVITFHCARHTCATMLLTLGADLYTVSKILGHRSVRHTQIYAKIIDSKKDDAVNLVNSIF